MPPAEMPEPLLRTKLRPPRVSTKLIPRPRLAEMLEEGANLPVTLVSAPAGYGKSTLVAEWLADSGRTAAWVSLDENDSDLRACMTYLLEAIESVAPGMLPLSRRIMALSELPPITTIARTLVNELDAVEEPLIVAFDDYHLIHALEVHELLSEIVRHPPACLRLMVITRIDPPLPLVALRTGGLLGEVRAHDLRFTPDEIAELMGSAFGLDLDRATAERVEATTEGWPVGLHLTGLSLRDRNRPAGTWAMLEGNAAVEATALVGELLKDQAPAYRDSLLRLSVVDQFCAPLCEAVCRQRDADQIPEGSGAGFLAWLERSDLFIIALDRDRTWFRFHHLFRDFLRHELEHRFGGDGVATAHRHAAIWHADVGFLDEALDHWIVSGDVMAAVDLIHRHRHALMATEQWSRLDRWLLRLPPEALDTDIDLQILRAWILENSYRYEELLVVLSRIDERLAADAAEEPEGATLGELEAMWAVREYFTGDGHAAAAHADRALELLPAELPSQRGFALVVHAFAHQVVGRFGDAVRGALTALSRPEIRGTTLHGRLLVGLCFIHWIEADVERMIRFARELLEVGLASDLPESVSFARYFLGVGFADIGQYDEAVRILRAEIAEPVVANPTTRWYATFLAALLEGSHADVGLASEMAESLAAQALERRNPELIRLSDAFQAELDLRQGRVDRAVAWARAYEPKLMGSWWRWYLAESTFVRALLAEGKADSLRRAADTADALHRRFRTCRNRRFLIDVLVLQSIAAERLGDAVSAVSNLAEAADLAADRGVVRPFWDSAEEISALVERMPAESPQRCFVEGAIGSTATPGASRVTPRSKPHADHLTNRELDVLELLSERLTNKEIGVRLGISPATVKRHLTNLLQKLGAQRRREAVERAKERGLP